VRKRWGRCACGPSVSASAGAPVAIASETNLEDILATLEDGPQPDLVVLDSIQTLWSAGVDSAPGTVTQVRACAQQVIRYAKRTGASVILVGHVTKDGQIAGPRVVEHMVDAVLYFEGDRTHHFRVLRGVKNRFGATDEIGVFEMTGSGLQEVQNPSELFLGDRVVETPGSVVFAGLEGTRPILGGNPGAGCALLARHAAPRGGRLGLQQACHGAGRA
jgi:DNA repair protein RadA/Sms